MTTTSTARTCKQCGHAYSAHSSGITGRCTCGTCECPWFKVDPRTGR